MINIVGPLIGEGEGESMSRAEGKRETSGRGGNRRKMSNHTHEKKELKFYKKPGGTWNIKKRGGCIMYIHGREKTV